MKLSKKLFFVFFCFALLNLIGLDTAYCQGKVKLERVRLADVNYCNSGEYDLVFSDYFDSLNVNTNKWYTYVPPWGSKSLDNCVDCRTGNTKTKQIYKDENVVQRDGICNLTVKDETTKWLSATTDYSSGYLYSKAKFRFGRVEMTCKLPAAEGLYPSFWMFAGSGDGTKNTDEIDIFEFCTASSNVILSNIHGCYDKYGNPTPECNEQKRHDLGFDYTANWFTIGVDWSPYEVKWYIDILDGSGPKVVRTFPKYYTLDMEPVTSCDISAGEYLENPIFPDIPMHIRANLRVKPCNGSTFVEESKFPQNFEIREITVHQTKPCSQTEQLIELDLFEDTEWNEDQYLSNLTLANNVTLTINNATVSFASMGQLKMRNGSRLILNGSTLTSCDPSVKWQGVNTSQNLSTIIEMNNGSIVENAIVGIHLQDITWGVEKDLMSTLIMDSSRVRNCDTGIKIDFGNTTSKISNGSVIEDCRIGVQLNRSNGLIINNTDFVSNDEWIKSIDSNCDYRMSKKVLDRFLYVRF